MHFSKHSVHKSIKSKRGEARSNLNWLWTATTFTISLQPSWTQVEFAAREMEHIIRSAPDLIWSASTIGSRHNWQQEKLPSGIIGNRHNWTTRIFSGGKGEPSRPLRSGAVGEEGFVQFKINRGSRQIFYSISRYLPSLLVQSWKF